MSNLEQELTDPNFILNDLFERIQSLDEIQLSVMEKHVHGESFAIEKEIANTILARVKEIRDNDPKRQIISTTLAADNLARVIPELIAENNKRLLTLFRELYLKYG